MDSNESLQLLETDRSIPSREQSQGKEYSTFKAALRKSVGYLAIAAAQVTAAISWDCVQALGTSLPPFQLNLLRYSVLELLVLGFIAAKRTDVRVKRESIPYMVIVSFASNAASFSWYEAAKYLPGGTLACFGLTISMLTTAAVGVFQTRRCLLHTMVAILLCVTGSVLYAQPDILFGGNADPVVVRPLCGECVANPPSPSLNCSHQDEFVLNMTNGDHNDTSLGCLKPEDDCIVSFKPNVLIGYIYCVVMAVSYTTLAVITNSKLSEVHPIVNSFWTGVSTVLTCLAAMLLFETPTLPVGPLCWTLMIAHSVTAGVDPLLQVAAMRLLDPVIYMIMGSLVVVLMCISQYSVMHDIYPGDRNALTIAGAVFVILGNVSGPLYRMCKEMKAKDVDEKEKSSATSGNIQTSTQ